MKKLIALALTLVLLLGAAGALADPESYYGKTLPDFTVKTLDGEDFTLSESLKSHDLVLINFWATWCGPCRMEFPFLQDAWQQYADRIDVIALSVEETDTIKKLQRFAEQNGLTFRIGRDETGIFSRMRGNAIPTTLIVDRDGKIVYVDVGAKVSTDAFTELFDSLLNEVRVDSGLSPSRNVRRRAHYNKARGTHGSPGLFFSFPEKLIPRERRS